MANVLTGLFLVLFPKRKYSSKLNAAYLTFIKNLPLVGIVGYE